MEAGEPLAHYFLKRLKVLYRRRYSPAWRRFNVFLDGAAISKKQTPAKTPVHFAAWLLDPTDRVKPLWGGPVEKPTHWGLYYDFRYYGYGGKVETKGYVKVIDHLVQVYSSSWNDNRLATAGGDSWAFELADPDCIEKVVTKFKRMFPLPQVRK